MTTQEAMKKYDDSLEWLNDNYPFFLTLVLNLGAPEWNKNVPTACVAIMDEKDSAEDFKFFINPDFFETLTVEQAASVLGHETLHIALNHLVEAHMTEQYPVEQALVLSHEVIVNDRLITEGFDLPDNVFTGPKTINIDTTPYPTVDVYQMIVDKKDKDNTQDSSDNQGQNSEDNQTQNGENNQSSDKSDNFSDDSNSSTVKDSSGQKGNTNSQDSSASQSSISSVGENSVGGSDCYRPMTKEEAEQITKKFKDLVDDIVKNNPDCVDSISDDLKVDLDIVVGADMQKSSMAGSSYTENVEQAAQRMGISANWAKILTLVNPDILQKKGRKASQYRTSWVMPRRNIAHMYPKVIIPQTVAKGNLDRKNNRGNNKELIVLALDLSSSIPRELVNPLLELARSIPQDLIEVEVCTFSTGTVPFNINKKDNKLASGGTSFDCVEDYALSMAQKHHKDYPKSVICITDGEASFNRSFPKVLDNWTWLMTKTNYYFYENRVNKEKIFLLKDFVKDSSNSNLFR